MAAQQPIVTLNDGNTMPQLGFGVFQIPDDAVTEAVKSALSAGYRSIDTAQGYHNEEGVGRAIQDGGVPRDELFITTKLTNGEQGYDSTLRAFDASMDKLGIDVLDLFLIHWPVPSKDLYVETWKAFVRLKEEGRVRSLGVSNFLEDHLARIIGETGVTPVLNQIELHPKFQQKALRAVDERLGIKTEAWSPIGRGRLLDEPVLTEIARKHGKTSAQVILRWHLDIGNVVIPKSKTPSRIAENFQVFDFALDADDLARIEALDAADGRIGPDPANFG
ncbi:aldo/keto reductase [Consotaella aegiceratis]|uniref:aldo/keto reductase n=1 Tax=Consotaella aegiceratis TaxID=3097961 RepID=UPI002F4164DE